MAQAGNGNQQDGDRELGGDSGATGASLTTGERLYFFPDQAVSEQRVRAILDRGSLDERAWVVSHLLRYAQWDDIWTYVDRDAVRAIFERLDLPESLRAAWARMLKIEAPVG